MAAPKKNLKISVKTNDETTDELAKKIEATAEQAVSSAKAVKINVAAAGAPEVDNAAVERQLTSDQLLVEKDNQQLKQESKAKDTTTAVSSAPELNEDNQTDEEAEIDQTDIAKAVSLEKTVGELAEESTDSVNPEDEFSDPETTAAIDDIVAKESDQILEAEDRARDEAAGQTIQKKEKQPGFLRRAMQNPGVRWGLLTGLLLLLATTVLIPNSRYAILNAAGIRSSSSVVVIDKTTKLPLKNVQVTLQKKVVLTDNDGKAAFGDLRLGSSELIIEKRGFAPVKKAVVLGWGSNPLSPEGIDAVGSVFVFQVKDYASGNPISNAEATSGDASAKANEKGEIRLVVDQYDGDVSVDVTSPQMRKETLAIGVQDKSDQTVAMVPDHSNIFISKRSGEYDVYQIDADGKNEKVLLAATGKERDDIHLVAHPYENVAALVSTREGNRNKDRYVMSGLFIIEPGEEPVRIAEAERIRIIDWQNKDLIYVQTFEGDSAASAQRSRLKSFNIETGDTKELATANYFNDVILFGGEVYYAPSSYAVNVDSVKFYKVKTDGTGRQTVIDKEVWNVLRADYDTIAFSEEQNWYELKKGSTTSALPSPPVSQRSKIFEDNQSKTVSLWVDERDGKGVLIRRNSNDGAEKVLVTASGLSQPVRWLNDTTATYRVITSTETADYVVSLNGGEPKKVVDVTNTGSAEDYYY